MEYIYYMLKKHYALQISIKRFRNDYRYYKITSFKLKKLHQNRNLIHL